MMYTGGVTGALKLVFTRPRPLYYSSEVQAVVCEGDFGSPSGHSVMAVAVTNFLAHYLDNQEK